ncbi:hypothetical protein SKAU_G00402690 [Synaphobranchus kaupii]|uniref:C2H2-type domain-containing protein n=1 Tax=Synaphobranchus kaupii TaxID=118154 RepID=A0A9Q1E9C9_SYNKA|nr:hypothetical protein SKAU_G00402690 [Synaphobranchus kaupii]
MSATNYALGMSHTKTVTKGFPLQSLPESTNQKNIHLFVFRNVDRQQEKEARVEGGERDWDLEEFVEKDVKPEVSSLIPPLPHSLASSDQGAKIKQEAADPCSQVVPWDGEPIEEDEDLDHSGGELQCDDLASLGDCSEYDPGSDVSSESISSGNSSGSSYTPNKRRGKSGRTRRGHRGRKLSRVASNPVTIAPTQQPVASDSVKFHLSSREQPNPQPSILAVVKQNIHLPDTSTPVANKVLSRPALKPSRMYACDRCREVFPEQVTYRRHHCTLRTAAVMSWSAPTSIPAPATTAATVQNPAVAPITAPMALRTATVPSASNLVSTSGPMPSSSSGVMKVTQMAVPCTIQNSTLVSPLPVASGPSFTLPSIMLPSPSSSVQSGSRPIMATVVFNGNDSAGRVARLVLQSQGLTFPTHTLSQTQPIRLSVPTQANALTPGQARASPSMQLANLMLGSLIQPQTLIKSPNLTPPSAPSPVPAPGPARTPASAPIPAPVLTSAPVPIPTTAPTPTSIAGPAPISTPTLIPATATITMPTPITGPTPITAPAPIPVSFTIPAPLPASFPASAPEPVRILGMFANCSQELALQKRLKKSWRSKGIFLCRQCGAISRQPSLGVRHRYLHRGSRRHRCHCGRTFLHRLHLLRHHVQHAEATRFVCAPCGQTFSGARCLARHKQGREGTRKRKRKKRVSSRKDCHAPFSCDCGQIFQRPTAFLWHKLKNPKE